MQSQFPFDQHLPQLRVHHLHDHQLCELMNSYDLEQLPLEQEFPRYHLNRQLLKLDHQLQLISYLTLGLSWHLQLMVHPFGLKIAIR